MGHFGLSGQSFYFWMCKKGCVRFFGRHSLVAHRAGAGLSDCLWMNRNFLFAMYMIVHIGEMKLNLSAMTKTVGGFSFASS